MLKPDKNILFWLKNQGFLGEERDWRQRAKKQLLDWGYLGGYLIGMGLLALGRVEK